MAAAQEGKGWEVGAKPQAIVSGTVSTSQSFAKDLALPRPLPERVDGRGPSYTSLIKKNRAGGASSRGARKSGQGSRRASWKVKRRAVEHACAAAEKRIASVSEEQETRKESFAREDRAIITELEARLSAARLARGATDLQRAVDGADLDDGIVREGLLVPLAHSTSAVTAPAAGDNVAVCADRATPSRPMPPLDYCLMDDLPKELARVGDACSVIDDAARDEAEMLRQRRAAGGGGPLDLEQFQGDQVAAASGAAAGRLADKRVRWECSRDDLDVARAHAALRCQRFARGFLGRKEASRMKRQRAEKTKRNAATIVVQTSSRGWIAREHARVERGRRTVELVLEMSAIRLQRVGRGMLGRRRAMGRRMGVVSSNIQRFHRGYQGRRIAARQREVLEVLRRRNRAVLRIQARWRYNRAIKEYAQARAFSLAAVEIQRVCRGAIGRKKVARRLEWERAASGPARLKLGIRLMEGTQVAFGSQRLEIEALHNAEEHVAVRTSGIRNELEYSEKDLGTLEREMDELAHIESELSQLTHERSLLELGLLQSGPTTLGDVTESREEGGGEGGEGYDDGDGGQGTKRGAGAGAINGAAKKEEAFALEMKIQVKRAEREKIKQDLEADFRTARAEVDSKRRELDQVSGAIGEIEDARERKTAELRRMQANLMELLREQKAELDSVREKGVQMEMEELMKFQFMSMSLSYLSSLNMLKTMRAINADTTTAAVTSGAEAALAAAAAEAASLPPTKVGKALESVGDEPGQKVIRTNIAIREKIGEQTNLDEAKAHPFPGEVRFWTPHDVGRFLTTLSLGQYRQAFEEAAADGEFLLTLNPDDCRDVLGVQHPLHSKKLFLAIDKLRPLTREYVLKKASVEHEQSADARRWDGVPVVEKVFSQVRNGHLTLLEDSLEKGFPVDAEDEHGNTALMVACQNCNMQICEVMLRRGADINHRNSRGNTALHYAMVYDLKGAIGEMLIARGGDDTILNTDGLACYDGLAP